MQQRLDLVVGVAALPPQRLGHVGRLVAAVGPPRKATGGALRAARPVGPGIGDKVSTRVDFSNWLTNESRTAPRRAPSNVGAASFGATATASSTSSARTSPPSSVIDGERDGNAWGAGGGWNDATRGAFPDSVEVNLNVTQTVNVIDVYTLKNSPNNGSTVGDVTPATSYGITSFEVQTWDGAQWVTVPGGAVTGNTRAKRRFSFATAISTDRVCVVVHGSADNTLQPRHRDRGLQLRAGDRADADAHADADTDTDTGTHALRRQHRDGRQRLDRGCVIDRQRQLPCVGRD